MQETDPYTVRLPGGRTITRQIPRGASDAQIRDAFRTPLARAGYDVSRSPILPGSQPVRERVQPRPLTRDPSNPTPNALAREYRPTWGQWLGDRVNALAEPLFGTTTANRMREEIGYVPFLGDAHFAGEGVSNIGAGNTFTGLGQVGLAAVGAVPVVGDAAAAGLRGGVRQVGGMFGGRGAGQGIRAYHGSPYDFDRFSLDHIGRGEGNQAYGNGLYFADRPGVAASYVTTRGTEQVRDVPDALRVPLRDALRRNDYLGFDTFGEAVSAIRAHPDWSRRWEVDNADEITRLFQGYDAARFAPGYRPRMYEVNINTTPDRLLNWERPLREQPAARLIPHRAWDDRTGGQIVNHLGRQAPDTLRAAGIPGVSYLDGASRTAGQGSRNYVIWDDSLIDILNKY